MRLEGKERRKRRRDFVSRWRGPPPDVLPYYAKSRSAANNASVRLAGGRLQPSSQRIVAGHIRGNSSSSEDFRAVRITRLGVMARANRSPPRARPAAIRCQFALIAACPESREVVRSLDRPLRLGLDPLARQPRPPHSRTLPLCCAAARRNACTRPTRRCVYAPRDSLEARGATRAFARQPQPAAERSL